MLTLRNPLCIRPDSHGSSAGEFPSNFQLVIIVVLVVGDTGSDIPQSGEHWQAHGLQV
jgi:hypothetical protein